MATTNSNPRKWRYTYEAQSHLPLLKLFLFPPLTDPISLLTDLIIDLNIDLIFEKSLINLTYNNKFSSNLITLVVPLPRVLVDLDSPLNFKILDDHIEVKIPLLLPVDHPIVSSFISELNSGGDDFVGDSGGSDFLRPLSMDSDFTALSSKGEVEFYCRSCGFKLTRNSVRCLVDLPSVNWTDIADNWFGGCCCSFGGVSEKLVANYVKSYRCIEGTCLLTTASVILCKDDILGFKLPSRDPIGKCMDKVSNSSTCITNSDVAKSGCCSTEGSPGNGSSEKQGDQSANGECTETDNLLGEKPSSAALRLDLVKGAKSEHDCCTNVGADPSLKDQELIGGVGLELEQKSFLNCYLGNAFSFTTSGLSKDIEWLDFACPQCSRILGAYPCADGSEPFDGGIRLLKCYISLSPPSNLSDDLFRKYTLERMFTCQLLESARDELSFRTVVKDLKTKSSMLQIVLVNPNSWCCSGWCSEDTPEQFVKINLHPVIKVLFSHCSDDVKPESRTNQDWELKNQADELYMSKYVIKELVNSMENATETFPPSFSSNQQFMLSYIPR